MPARREPLERGDEHAVVPRRGGTRTHAVRQEQARRSGVGESSTRCRPRPTRLLLLTANTDHRTVRRPFMHLNMDALAALFFSGAVSVTPSSADRPAEKPSPCFMMSSMPLAVQFNGQPALRILHRAHAVDPSERCCVPTHLPFHQRLRRFILCDLRAKLPKNVRNACVLPGKQALVFLLLPPKAFALAQRKQCTVDGTHQLGQTRTPCRKMIGKNRSFPLARAAASAGSHH